MWSNSSDASASGEKRGVPTEKGRAAVAERPASHASQMSRFRLRFRRDVRNFRVSIGVDFPEHPFMIKLTRRFTVLMLVLSLSASSLAVTTAHGTCMTAKAPSPGASPSGGAHACCAAAPAPDSCATAHKPETCAAGMLAMSCCSVEPAPYRQTGAGALPASATVQPYQLDLSTPLWGFRVVEPVVHVTRLSSEMEASRSPPPLRALFCTYLI